MTILAYYTCLALIALGYVCIRLDANPYVPTAITLVICIDQVCHALKGNL